MCKIPESYSISTNFYELDYYVLIFVALPRNIPENVFFLIS